MTDAYQEFWQTYGTQAITEAPIEWGKKFQWFKVFEDYCQGIPLREACQLREVSPGRHIPERFLDIFQELVTFTAPQETWSYWQQRMADSDNFNFTCEVLSAYMNISSMRIRHMPEAWFARIVEEWMDPNANSRLPTSD
jgi:hypothetical protein